MHMNEAIKARERMASLGSPQATGTTIIVNSPIHVPTASTTTLKAEDLLEKVGANKILLN